MNKRNDYIFWLEDNYPLKERNRFIDNREWREYYLKNGILISHVHIHYKKCFRPESSNKIDFYISFIAREYLEDKRGIEYENFYTRDL